MDDFAKFLITGLITATIAICFNLYVKSQETKAAIQQGLIQCPDSRTVGSTLWQHSCN